MEPRPESGGFTTAPDRITAAQRRRRPAARRVPFSIHFRAARDRRRSRRNRAPPSRLSWLQCAGPPAARYERKARAAQPEARGARGTTRPRGEGASKRATGGSRDPQPLPSRPATTTHAPTRPTPPQAPAPLNLEKKQDPTTPQRER